MKKSLLFASLGICLVSFVYYWTHPSGVEQPVAVDSEAAFAPPIEPLEIRYPYTIKYGSNLVTALKELEVAKEDIREVLVLANSLPDLGRLNAGTRFQLASTEQRLSMIKIRLSPQRILLLEKIEGTEWRSQEILKEVEKKVLTFKGTVKTSLWDSAIEANVDPILIAKLSEIFAWQVDFAREVQVGDRWRLSVEEELVHGERIGWGSILSAEYTNRSESHTAVLFRKDDKDVGHFAPDGSSLRRIFLKSPIEFGRISSRFQRRRFHPVLKVHRPHNGVDYAAPTGTPIRVVGDGVVWEKGYNSAAGNFIKIRHNATYTTAYKHLSRFPKSIRRGVKVKQGQTIGYVGSTGLSSGPHLHFEFFMNGKFVDPIGMRFPAADPVSQNDLATFTEGKEAFLAYLPEWETSESASQ